MIVPFQMVMFTMSKMANILRLDNPAGIIAIYLGFGAGLSVFIYSGFINSILLEIEEAATIDGCSPIQTFFWIVFPILRPIAITVAILNTMWIWNDYLLPYLVIVSNYRRIPIAVQYLQGGYGSKDIGAMMAMLVRIIRRQLGRIRSFEKQVFTLFPLILDQLPIFRAAMRCHLGLQRQDDPAPGDLDPLGVWRRVTRIDLHDRSPGAVGAFGEKGHRPVLVRIGGVEHQLQGVRRLGGAFLIAPANR